MAARSAYSLLDGWDLLCLGALFVLWFCLVTLRYDALPLQIWDESRLANSALEIVRTGHWLVPTYSGVPDHWSVKPPILIWQMAALMWLGGPPLLAVRLPVMLAALATVGTIWVLCRYGLRDRGAAVLAGVLLLSSSYYNNIHIARTGDYDVPCSFFILLYVLAFWASIERNDKVHIGWFGIFTAALVLAVMTKGIAGTFGLVGLFVFSVMRGRLVALLTNVHVWSLALLGFFICIGYYLSRELYDPGYLQAVWENELGGRFFVINEGHAEGPLFYITLLSRSFEPGAVLLPTALFTIAGGESRRRSISTLCLLSAVTILAVLTTSRTKIYWYATPVLPFLAIAAALGVTDALRRVKLWEPRLPKLFRAPLLQGGLWILMAIVSVRSVYNNQMTPATQSSDGQLWYGALFDELRVLHNSSVTVIDSGYRGAAPNYNPMLKFYSDIAQTQGLRVKISGSVSRGELVATCDPKLIPWLKTWIGSLERGQAHSCIFGVSD